MQQNYLGFRTDYSGIPNKANNFFTGSACTNSYDGLVKKVEPIIKPSRAKVEIEELDSNLLSGVSISPLETPPGFQIDKPSAWPCVFYSNIGDNNWLKDNVFNMTIESYVKPEDKVKADEVWFPFTGQHVDNCPLICFSAEKFNKKSKKKWQKVIQRFTINLQPPADDDNKSYVPYVQFYCKPNIVRHGSAVFKKGDLMTVVIKHPNYPLHWPTPPIITVIPIAEQTFVPMLSKQKMMIVTDVSKEVVDFKAHKNGTVSLCGVVDAEFGKQCHYFQCTKPSHSSEIIFINQKKKNKDNKKVIVPFVEKEVRCPVILNPLKDSVIYCQNIEGFVIRFWKESYHPITILSGTPIRGVGTSENAQYIERRFEIEKKRPFFYLTKKDHSWVIR